MPKITRRVRFNTLPRLFLLFLLLARSCALSHHCYPIPIFCSNHCLCNHSLLRRECSQSFISSPSPLNPLMRCSGSRPGSSSEAFILCPVLPLKPPSSPFCIHSLLMNPTSISPFISTLLLLQHLLTVTPLFRK